MSFARWSEESDVYVIFHDGGFYACYWCHEAPDAPCWKSRTAAEMVSHLERHIARGDAVPSHTIPQLLDEAETWDRYEALT